MKQKLKQLYFQKKYRSELVLPTRITFSCMRHPEFQVGTHSRLGKNVGAGGARIKIGRFTTVNQRVELASPLEVGDFCAIARGVRFQGNTHDYGYPAIQDRLYQELFGTELDSLEKGGITVGDDVWIGRDALILPGITIGDHAIVGAGAVVTKDVEPFEIVGGNPAEHIGYRFNEDGRKEMRETGWTDWSLDRIKNRQEFFTSRVDGD